MATTKFSTIIGSAQVVPVIGVLERVTSYTIGGSTTAPTPGAGATFLRVTEQYGPMAKVRFEYKQTSAGSSGSGIYQFPLSTLITVDTTRLGNGVTSTANNICGHGAIQIGANGFEAYAYYNPTLNIISLQYDPQGVASTSYLTVDNTNGSLGNATLLVSFDVWLPITNSPSVAQGAGLATSVKAGLVPNAIPVTNLVNTDLAPTTNLTIDAGDVLMCKYSMSNNLVTLIFKFDTVTITAASTIISFTLPSSVPKPAVQTIGSIIIYDNTASAYVAGQIVVNLTGVCQISKTGTAAFTGGTNTSYLYGQVSWNII